MDKRQSGGEDVPDWSGGKTQIPLKFCFRGNTKADFVSAFVFKVNCKNSA
ncbi:MAG TPA: hypothetical protein VF599_02290 [Pyrinomonadaceae bacterium]|jgi:hypothetical protein